MDVAPSSNIAIILTCALIMKYRYGKHIIQAVQYSVYAKKRWSLTLTNIYHIDLRWSEKYTVHYRLSTFDKTHTKKYTH